MEVTGNDIRSWVISMMESGYSSSSVHRKVSTLRSYYRYLRREKLIKRDPVEKVILPRRRKSLPVFVEETRLGHCLISMSLDDDFEGVRDKTLIEMFYLTGMRRAELIALRNSDIDYLSKCIKVTGKRNKQRIIPLIDSF